MTPEEELELIMKKIKNTESQLSVLDSCQAALIEENNEIQKRKCTLWDDYHRLKLESFSTDQEKYDYILDSINSSHYINNNYEKYLPKGCCFGGIIIGNNQRKIILNLNLEPSKNEEKLEKIFSHIKDTNLNFEFSRNIISTSTHGKYMTLISTDAQDTYSLIYANDIDSYYLVYRSEIVSISKTISSVLYNLKLHIGKNNIFSCSGYFL